MTMTSVARCRVLSGHALRGAVKINLAGRAVSVDGQPGLAPRFGPQR